MDVCIVFYIVSYIGVNDLYEYQSHGDNWWDTKSNKFFRNTGRWIAEWQIPTTPEGAAPGRGWIADCLIVDDRTGRPHNTKGLITQYGVHKHQTTGGRDYFS